MKKKLLHVVSPSVNIDLLLTEFSLGLINTSRYLHFQKCGFVIKRSYSVFQLKSLKLYLPISDNHQNMKLTVVLFNNVDRSMDEWSVRRWPF